MRSSENFERIPKHKGYASPGRELNPEAAPSGFSRKYRGHPKKLRMAKVSKQLRRLLDGGSE